MEIIEAPKRAMLVIPHPDDGESGCGGTVSTWIKQGTEVLYVVATNGDKGSSDPHMTSERLASIREGEQKVAAERLGVKELVFLGYGDGELEDDPKFRGQVVHHIRRWRPDVVFAMDPMRTHAFTHRDHRISGQVTLDACFPFARDVLHYPEDLAAGLSTHKVGTVLLWGAETPDVVVDISSSIENKLGALAAHESQLSDMSRSTEFVTNRAKDAASRASDYGFDYKYAELYRRISFRI